MLEAEKSFRRLKAHKAASDFERRVAASSANVARRQAHCQQESGTIGFTNGGCCCTNFNRHRDALKYQVSGAQNLSLFQGRCSSIT
jgi:hypothetical protein